MILSRKISELVTQDFTPGGECSAVDSPTYRTMAMAEFLELTLDFISYLAAITPTRNHENSSMDDLAVDAP